MASSRKNSSRRSKKSYRRSKKTVKDIKDILLVCDIDETLIQFLHAKNGYLMKKWDECSMSEKNKLHYIQSEKNKHVTIFRPYLQKLFDFCQANHIRIGLWTLSERSYGKSIACQLANEFQLPSHFFLFVYGEEDVGDDEYSKDLTKVWKKFPMYNCSNTFLIDDLKSNIIHDINRKNGLLTPRFVPFDKNDGYNKDMTKDKTIKEVIKLLTKIIRYNDRNNDDRRCIFDTNRMKDMKISSYVKPIVQNVIDLASIGRKRQTFYI